MECQLCIKCIYSSNTCIYYFKFKPFKGPTQTSLHYKIWKKIKTKKFLWLACVQRRLRPSLDGHFGVVTGWPQTNYQVTVQTDISGKPPKTSPQLHHTTEIPLLRRFFCAGAFPDCSTVHPLSVPEWSGVEHSACLGSVLFHPLLNQSGGGRLIDYSRVLY